MNIKQLEYLSKIAECHSITKAAQQLFVSQPSLTKAVNSLEEEYNVKIFERSSHGVTLTEEGRNFIYYSKAVIAAADTLNQNFSANPTQSSRLFLASQQLDFVYKLLLQTYEACWDKRIHYVLTETDRVSVTKLILEGEANLGLIVCNNGDGRSLIWRSEADRLDIQVLDSARVYACVGPTSPFFHRDIISFAEAESVPSIVLDIEPQGKQTLSFDTQHVHFNTKKVLFCNSIGSCAQFLLNTNMLLYVSKWTIGCFSDPRIHVVEVETDIQREGELYNQLCLIKRKGVTLDPTEQTFVKYLANHFNLSPDSFFR